MPKTDREALSPGQQWRLRVALDRVMPPLSPPRYRALPEAGLRPWRFAPATLALGVTGVLALSAFAATGSANPAVWGQRAASTIESVRQAPAAPAAPLGQTPANVHQAPKSSTPPESSGKSQSGGQPEPTEKPEQPPASHEASGARTGGGGEWPNPHPSPSQHPPGD